MAANTIELSGWDEFEKKLLDVATLLPEEMNEAAQFAAQRWEQGAKMAAPKDVGFLAGGISSKQVSLGVWEVDSQQEYSAYMEWGTKTKVSVPAELSSYAEQFRGVGSGGDAKAFIYAWAKRKGLPPKAWWPVFISIIRFGVRPHPFFFIQRPVVEQQLLGDLEQMINTPR